ncbi:hypothetical protein EHS13_02160 [Paenibacillus psychroresistens]|uniref:Uncharacterized protein n=1 Tax=Paenibacillus psychroresistens TaxID=1778678 RepID=A0A6B8RAU7_9BACL|nr:hypothetical protein [Paenibacillus psychroresistens]QGQ93791.1 hypothetical protein EHS13_02160 [Paenibacillus psychroresistens]
MARGRKSNYINKLTSKDQAMLRAFRNCGFLQKSHLQDKLGLSDRRIENFIRDQYIEKCVVDNNKTKEAEYVYRLSKKGQELCKNHLNLSNFYASQSVRHDNALAKKYFEMSSEQQLSWLTERDWRDRFEAKISDLRFQGKDQRADELISLYKRNLLSLPDGGYSNGESIVAVEVTTSSYGNEEIQAKENFTQIMNAKFHEIKI